MLVAPDVLEAVQHAFENPKAIMTREALEDAQQGFCGRREVVIALKEFCEQRLKTNPSISPFSGW